MIKQNVYMHTFNMGFDIAAFRTKNNKVHKKDILVYAHFLDGL